MKQTLFLCVAFSIFAVNANATGETDLSLFKTQGLSNVRFDQTGICASFSKGETDRTWAAQFNPPTWIEPSDWGNEPFEIYFEAKYVGEGTGGDGVGHITFQQARQIPGLGGDLATLCSSLGIEEQDATWKIQYAVEQLVVSEFTDAPADFEEGKLNRNVHFHPTSEWQSFSMKGILGRHAQDSVDISMEFGTMAGDYSIRNFVFVVNGAVFESYFCSNDFINQHNFTADNHIIDGLMYYLSHETAKVVGIANTTTDVTIPQTVEFEGKNYNVKKIGKNAFRDRTNLTSVTIGDFVKSIGGYAFSGCKNLKTITLGSSVEEIGQNVFEGCNSLESIVCKSTYPPEVTNNMLASNEKDRVILYVNAKLTIPNGTYRKVQPWSNFDFEEESGEEQKTDTIYVIGTSAGKFGIKATTADAKMGMAIGSGKYEKDEDAEIVAIEKYGYHFTKWSDGNTDNPRFVKVSADSTFKAEFEVNNYNVLAAANEKKMGRVEGADTYAYLSRTQLKAVPNDGYQFKEWSDGEITNPRNILVYSDTAFTAVFVATEATAIGDELASTLNIYTLGNTIIVENATEEICVYDAMGRLIGKIATPCVRAELQVNTAGVYLVKVGNVAKRVMVND